VSKSIDFGFKKPRVRVRVRESSPMCISRVHKYLLVKFHAFDRARFLASWLVVVVSYCAQSR